MSKQTEPGSAFAPATGYATAYKVWSSGAHASVQIGSMVVFKTRDRDEAPKACAELNRLHANLALLECALCDDSIAITFQSFGQYRSYLLRVLRGQIGQSHNDPAHPQTGENQSTEKGN